MTRLTQCCRPSIIIILVFSLFQPKRRTKRKTKLCHSLSLAFEPTFDATWQKYNNDCIKRVCYWQNGVVKILLKWGPKVHKTWQEKEEGNEMIDKFSLGIHGRLWSKLLGQWNLRKVLTVWGPKQPTYNSNFARFCASSGIMFSWYLK